MSHVTIVDERDNVIGSKDRESLVLSDIYRVSGLWLTNSKGEALLARRALTKSHNPGKWGPAVAGTVEEGEGYEENIIKEAYEELGIKDLKPDFWFKNTPRTEGYRFFSTWFRAMADTPAESFILQKDEVMEVKWCTVEELKRLATENPEDLIPSLREWILGGFNENGR